MDWKLQTEMEKKLTIASRDKFHGNMWVAFCPTQENTYWQTFHFKANRKDIGPSKKPYLGFLK